MPLCARWRPGLRRIYSSVQFFSTSSVHSMARTYEDAIAALNSLQSNFAIVDAIRKSGRGMNKDAIPEMIDWCKKIGYQPADLNCLNPIHIAGTKGKGSTCAFISSILSQYLPTATEPHPKFSKIGLYTSPHLRFVRERIQINSAPLSEADFAKYFFETWDRLEASAKAVGMAPDDPASKPVYFRFLTLMAFHAYISEGVDAAIIECGIGGEYDSTNILVQPVVTGITSLGIDHVAVLGNTIEEIAWHKGGIMKPGARAYAAPQPDAALNVLSERAKEIGVELEVTEGNPGLDPTNPTVQLGLSGEFQYKNAELAVGVAGAFLRARGVEDIPTNLNTAPLPSKFRAGLETARLGGRCDKRREKNVAWHIDGGHTLDSIEATGKWFASQPYAQGPSTPDQGSEKPRVLIFNQQTRDSVELARALNETFVSSGTKPFTHAIFCTNVTFKEAGYRPDLVSVNTNSSDVEKLSVQKALAETWKQLSPSTDVQVKCTIEEAVDFVRDLAASEAKKLGEDKDGVAVSVLVTGSLHLVGGLLEVLETTQT
ncbi:hypothetical protein AJ80_06059 [Polytolypa hystricis UAMH7299]|uniref:Folylpolyglutamate synthase n=1 Tax=Polytolypa hystricis (strain UAMH7299) TaxID=1447883 RepID=A0A2B7XYN4_POLH7|nr:hypothetical protein AJ80_06059 [Polytolypa hystricis UAMH7299]